jgi:hypothetical protein
MHGKYMVLAGLEYLLVRNSYFLPKEVTENLEFANGLS